MTLATILFLCAVFSFLALRSTFFGLKLMAGMSWFALFMYLKDNPPGAITEGSGVHTALLVLCIGFGLMIVLAGLGRGIQRSQKWGEGFEQSESFSWKLPSWLKFSENEQEKRYKESQEEIQAYRARLRQAYRRKTK